MTADLRIAELQRAVQMDPQNEGLRLHLSMLLGGAGRVQESESAQPTRIKSAKNALNYILSSNGKRPRRARFTVVNNLRGERITFSTQREGLAVSRDYDVTTDDNDSRWWVIGAMKGSDNNSFLRFGIVKKDDDGRHRFYHSSESSVSSEDKTVRVFAALWNTLSANYAQMPQHLEFHHEGCCGRCGKALTVPESIETGIGPVCGRHMASAEKPVQPQS